MPVDAELQPILDLVAAVAGAPPMEAGVPAARESFAAMCAAFGAGPAVVVADDLELAGRSGPITARRYRPTSQVVGVAGPTLVFLHGGGFVIGDVDTHDALCRRLAADAEVVVLSIGYRLAPEHPCPAAVEDVLDSLDDVIARSDELGVDLGRLAVGGDSAGGNLAALAALHHRDRCAADPSLAPLRLQLLIYPVVDLSGDEARHPSLRANAEGYLLTLEMMQFFEHHYLTGSGIDPFDPSVSPLAVDDLGGLAPAFVLTAEMDPLRDEGEAYAGRLADAGVEVAAARFDGAIHGFVQMGEITAIGRRAVDDCSAALRSALA